MSKAIYSALAKVLAAVLVAAGAAAIVGGKIAHSTVSEQLAQERIDMPSKGGIEALKDKESKEELRPYIGQRLTTGARPCLRATRCAACSSTPTAGGRWERSLSLPASDLWFSALPSQSLVSAF